MHLRGIFWASAAYAFWGFSPFYWKLLEHVSPMELLAHRALWSLVFLSPLVLFGEARSATFATLRREPKQILLIATTSALIGFNWYNYVIAMTTHRVLQSSLGYFMTPLVSVVLGLVILREKLNRAQTLAVLLAAVAVLAMVFAAGTSPTLALVLAWTFALYGLVKKFQYIPAYASLALETLFMAPAMIWYLALYGRFDYSVGTWVLLILSGPITAVPLLWYTWAVQSIPFFMVGFLQYISPILQFAIAVFIHQEPFDDVQKAAFTVLWFALALFSWDLYRRAQRSRRAVV